jgi:prevent-host-death family protein
MEIQPQDGIKPISDFRRDAAGVLEQLRSKRQPILLTQRGRSVAVLLDIETFEHMDYAFRLRASYQRGREDLKRGRLHDHADVVRDIRARAKR